MLSIYVFTAGKTTCEVFNAVSAFMKTGAFSKAMSIGVIFSIIGCAIQYIKTHDLMALAKWFGVYFCVSFLLVGVTTNVVIFNLTNPMNPYFVDNVPYGIAMPASIITSVEAGLTKGIEDVFHTPNDVSYATTGMLFGAQLFNAVNNGSTVLNSNTRNNFNHFVRQCIVPDILINNKYTFEQLSTSADVLSFLASKPMSQLRGIYMSGKFTTCSSALPIISQEIEGNVSGQGSWISHFLFGDQSISGNDLFSQIQNVYSYMMGMTDDASNILYQNTMINGIREGIGTQIAKNDSTAAMMNYGYTSAMQKQLLADNTLARVATYLLPLSQTVLILLMIGVFPVIALLSLQPMLFFPTLKNYVSSLIYLATWPILFTIINFVMTTELSVHMSAIAGNPAKITLSNQNELLYMSEQFAAYCGYLIALVPVIAGFIFKGLYAVFMNAAQTMMGNMQGWTSQTATALADGNVSLANTSIGNHNWNNWSANKHDTNYTNMSGMQTNQLQNGGTVTHTPLNSDIYNTSGATSQLATSIHAGDMITAQLSQSLDHSKQMTKQMGESYTHAINQSWSDLTSFANSHGLNTTQGHNYSISEQTSSAQAVSNIMGIVHDVAERNHMSEHEAYQHLTSGNFGINVDGGGGFSSPTRFAGVSGHVGAKANMGVSTSHSNTYGTSHDDGSSINVSSNEQKQFSENYSLIQNASSTQHGDQTHSQSLSQMSQLSSDFRQSDSIASQLSTSLSNSNRYSEMLSYAESHSGNINNNFSQAFAAHVEKTDPSEARNILGNTDNSEIAQKREALAESYIKNHYMNQFEKNFNEHRSSLNQQYQSESMPIENKSDHVIANFVEQKGNIILHSNQSGIHSVVDNHALESHVNHTIADTQSQIATQNASDQQSSANLAGDVNKAMANGSKKLKDGKSLWQDTPF